MVKEVIPETFMFNILNEMLRDMKSKFFFTLCHGQYIKNDKGGDLRQHQSSNEEVNIDYVFWLSDSLYDPEAQYIEIENSLSQATS